MDVDLFNEWILVRLKDPPNVTKGGVVLPDSVREGNVMPYGEIIAVPNDQDLMMNLKVGQFIYFDYRGALYAQIRGEGLYAVKEKAVVLRMMDIPDSF